MEKNRSTIDIDGIIKDLSKSLPYVFGNNTISLSMPCIITPNTIKNLIDQKKGPPYEIIDGNIFYERNSFLQWLKTWLFNITTSNTKTKMNKEILFRNSVNDVWTKGTLIKQNENSCAEIVVSISGFTTSLYIPINKIIPFENNESLEGTKTHISFNDKDLIIVSKGINHRWEIRLFKEYKNKYYYVYTDVDKSEDKFKYGVPYSSETSYLLTTITETQTLDDLGL